VAEGLIAGRKRGLLASAGREALAMKGIDQRFSAVVVKK
jgi:hypothetical protein